jgi:hypothetical protein
MDNIVKYPDGWWINKTDLELEKELKNKDYMDKVYLDYIYKEVANSLFGKLDVLELEINIINPNIFNLLRTPQIVTPYMAW